MRSVIIIFEQDKEPVLVGNLKKACRIYDLPYHSIKAKAYPISLEKHRIVIHKKKIS